ncbi:polysaccharide deacetylase family protein [Cohnella endophytica]|uniref:Polysaccharide deacetylase family protein n=1 Tax=Cohnella endophytica TaxID=2419778 RepID=A0A494Y2X7_9BACL|nr:polysaccharide deacetylase family protein [Cohnella endophytica]RKP57086.1 polysaccharide deacetylase family protein [Cohnella endophytica]
MNRRLIVICTSILLLGLVACNNSTKNGNTASPASSPQTSAAASPETSSSASASSSPATETDAQPPESGESNETPDGTAIAKAYKMNKNYFIVPIDKTKTDNKIVLLTFDDGPKAPETLDPLLDTLDKHNAKAIFFVNGYRVKAHPELLKEIDDRGQVIGNHSWDHIELGKEKAPKIEKQIADVQTIIEELTGKTPIFFRPPHASANEDVHRIAKEKGLLYMTWSNGSLDWDMKNIPEAKRPQAIIDNVMKQLHPGSNILMHELPWTAKTLDNLLTQLEQKGYSFVDPNAIDTTLS